MNKNNFISFLFIASSVAIIASTCTQKISAYGPIYLHQHNKAARSNQEHLEHFSSTGDVILQFYADWCNPCKRMSPLVDAVATQLSQFTFFKINRDFFMDLAKSFNITSIPTLIFLRDGKEIGRYDGGPLTETKLKQLILRIYGN
jgi:thioredoxin 1